jgi:hypothetical protein
MDLAPAGVLSVSASIISDGVVIVVIIIAAATLVCQKSSQCLRKYTETSEGSEHCSEKPDRRDAFCGVCLELWYLV